MTEHGLSQRKKGASKGALISTVLPGELYPPTLLTTIRFLPI